MRVHLLIAGLAMAGASTAASGRTIVVLADPMTLERRTVVLGSPGPDRAYLCVLPPGDSGCRELPIRRPRR